MATRSRRLVDPQQLPDVPAVIYTAPLNTVVLVKSIRAVNTSGATQSVWLTVNGTAESGAIWWAVPVEVGFQMIDDTWWVLESTDELYAVASDAAAVTLTIAGAELVDS